MPNRILFMFLLLCLSLSLFACQTKTESMKIAETKIPPETKVASEETITTNVVKTESIKTAETKPDIKTNSEETMSTNVVQKKESEKSLESSVESIPSASVIVNEFRNFSPPQALRNLILPESNQYRLEAAIAKFNDSGSVRVSAVVKPSSLPTGASCMYLTLSKSANVKNVGDLINSIYSVTKVQAGSSSGFHCMGQLQLESELKAPENVYVFESFGQLGNEQGVSIDLNSVYDYMAIQLLSNLKPVSNILWVKLPAK